MSWLRSAVHKAVEVGGNNNLTRTFRGYADTVVQQAGHAVAGGTKLFQERIGARNFKSFKLAVKGLEELSVSCRGIERVQLLRRWLVALKEVERLSGPPRTEQIIVGENTGHLISTNMKNSPRKPSLVLYWDPDLGGEPMNFRDVFLHSQALEGVTLSMILEAPNEEEMLLLMEIFSLCLAGGKQAHQMIITSIRVLARAFSSYEDEVLAKKEELLQYAQDAIAGLKVNGDILRIDCEISSMHQSLDQISLQPPSNEIRSSEAVINAALEDPKEALECIQLLSMLEVLLRRKKSINNGDSPGSRAQKVDKLKVLSESLTNSASKAEKRISEHRFQKEEALNFRVTRTREFCQLEKELDAEIEALEKEQEELEAQLRKVNTSLGSARTRLRIAKEERDQFDEASNQILQHFQVKEDELSRSLFSCRTEADVCANFINFLEDTWTFQLSYIEEKAKQVSDELEKCEDYFVQLAVRLLSAYKEHLKCNVSSIKKLAENLKGSKVAGSSDDVNTEAVNSRKKMEEEYINAEAKLLTMFSVVESIKSRSKQGQEVSRKSDDEVKELLDAIESIKHEFESIQGPNLAILAPTPRLDTPTKERPQSCPPLSTKPDYFESSQSPTQDNKTPRDDRREKYRRSLSSIFKHNAESPERKNSDEIFESRIKKKEKSIDPEAELSKLKLELELEDHNGDYLAEDIDDWESDIIDKELKNVR